MDGELIQWPVEEIESLRGDYQTLSLDNSGTELSSKSFDLSVTLNWGSTLSLFKDSDYQLDIRLDSDTRTLFLDRTKTEIREGDTVRELALKGSEQVELRILADTSSVELFINQGEYVMTSRVFTPKTARGIYLQGQAELEIWTLNPASKPFI